MTAEEIALTTLARRIVSVDQLVNNLFFTAVNEHNPSPRDKALVLSFKKAFLGYLSGSGHPEGTRGTIVSEAVFDSEKHDPLCRAKLVLKACRASSLLPVGDWEIKARISA